MRSIANRAKLVLQRLGYDYSSGKHFSVELTSNAIVVNQKIDLSHWTNEKDEMKLVFFLRESRFGGPLEVNSLSTSLYRLPANNNLQPSIQMDKKFIAANEPIPSQEKLIDLISQQLYINRKNERLINKTENIHQSNEPKPAAVKKKR